MKTKVRQKAKNLKKCKAKMCQGKPKVLHHDIKTKYDLQRKIRVQIKKIK